MSAVSAVESKRTDMVSLADDDPTHLLPHAAIGVVQLADQFLILACQNCSRSRRRRCGGGLDFQGGSAGLLLMQQPREHRFAKRDLVAVFQRRGFDPVAIDQSAVGAAKVVDPPSAVLRSKREMLARHPCVVQDSRTARIPPEREFLVANVHRSPRLRPAQETNARHAAVPILVHSVHARDVKSTSAQQIFANCL
jgi:hypothetical protein